ncbi:glycosyltransferase [Spiribacter halobius]|uniref:Glycosyl transferase n=1 Tax=Sediminicurvatus halobius TaxID=2182432 RepID=A0A2U2N736_9GAMM|nr:glycosyltransferase [Spiribacter halobius]PWG64902.1 glycosyl transferase [Spiribacter halobius]UEX78242.1 glycosyltransferase [Spiribacter halobius]
MTSSVCQGSASGVTLALFMATSGHSGVDRVVANLLTGMVRLGYRPELLRIRDHGPYLPETPELSEVSQVSLPAEHVNTALPALVRYLRSKRPDCLLTDKYKVNRIALTARWLSGTTTRLALRIGTTVSVDLASRGRLDRVFERWCFRHLYPATDAVIMPSRQAADDLERLAGWPDGRVTAVPSPIVDTERFRAIPRPDHPWFRDGSVPVIVGAGELCGRKDFETLLRAFARLRQNRPARLVILGRGGRLERLRRVAGELGVAEEVDFPGFVSRPEMYMAHASAFALTSRWEGAPVVLIEALACGTPVVSTDCPSGPREILGNGRHGPLVPMGDDAALANALRTLIDAPPDPDQLRAAARPYELEASALAYLRAMGAVSGDDA